MRLQTAGCYVALILILCLTQTACPAATVWLNDLGKVASSVDVAIQALSAAGVAPPWLAALVNAGEQCYNNGLPIAEAGGSLGTILTGVTAACLTAAKGEIPAGAPAADASKGQAIIDSAATVLQDLKVNVAPLARARAGMQWHPGFRDRMAIAGMKGHKFKALPGA